MSLSHSYAWGAPYRTAQHFVPLPDQVTSTSLGSAIRLRAFRAYVFPNPGRDAISRRAARALLRA